MSASEANEYINDVSDTIIEIASHFKEISTEIKNDNKGE